MILAALVQFVVCFLILAWILKKKTGELVNYIVFHLAIWKNREVACWPDVIIAAIVYENVMSSYRMGRRELNRSIVSV